MTRTFLGAIYTDTASLLLVDPCRVLRNPESETPSYDELMERVFPPDPPERVAEWDTLFGKMTSKDEKLTDDEFDRLKVLTMRAPPPRSLPFADGLYVRGDNDGYYHVWLETEGDTARVVIELTAMVKPN
jgi:hypothetical protein